MAFKESEHFVPAPEIKKPSYADYLVADPRNPNLANVKLKEHGYYISYIASDYDSLPDTEKNKIGKVAANFRIGEKDVQAALDYRYVHPEEINAKISLDKVQEGDFSRTVGEIKKSQNILRQSEGEKDIHLDWDKF